MKKRYWLFFALCLLMATALLAVVLPAGAAETACIESGCSGTYVDGVCNVCGKPIPETRWGASKDNLTGSGTLAEAIAAANATDSTIKYICLNKSWTAPGTDETYCEIEGSGLTFDLNGQTVSAPLCLRALSGSVTFTDSVGGGQWENTATGGDAVIVYAATATFTGGSYKSKRAVYVTSSSAVVVIKGGTFTGTNRNVILNSSGTLTVEGGIFNGTYGVCSGSDSQTTTIKGGNFSNCNNRSISYWGGTLDLSSYPTTTTTDTTSLTDLTVINWAAVTVGTNVKLPAGYGFYKADDATQTIVTTLAADSYYAIKLTVTPEAKWGTSKDNLTGSGTLAEAGAAAKNDSTIKYICLNKSWTATGTSTTYYRIQGEGITIDLNGQTVSGPMSFRAVSGSVTFTDSVGGGKWENTANGSSAVTVDEATVTVTGGSYKGTNAVLVNSSSAVVVIEGGTFTGTGVNAIVNSGGKLTIKGGVFSGTYGVSSITSFFSTITGGDFSACTTASFYHYSGTLDLSGYPTTATAGTTPITAIKLHAVYSFTVGTDIKLPADYGFYKVGDTAQTIVTTLAEDSYYAIKIAETVSVTITWTAMEFTYTDGAWNPATHSYADGTWSPSGGTVTVQNTGDVAVTASFAYVTTRTDISGSFTKQSFDLAENASDTTKLTLSGKPSESLDHESLGSITVTIAQKSE